MTDPFFVRVEMPDNVESDVAWYLDDNIDHAWSSREFTGFTRRMMDQVEDVLWKISEYMDGKEVMPDV